MDQAMYSACPVVATVHFQHSNEVPDVEAATWRGLPLWKVKGRSVYDWAIDQCVAGDQQFIVLGPFVNCETATAAVLATFGGDKNFRGYVVDNEHCWIYTYKKRRSGHPHSMYTDG